MLLPLKIQEINFIGADITDEGVWKWITGESFNTNALQGALVNLIRSEDGQHYLRITDDSPPYSYLMTVIMLKHLFPDIY